MFWPTASGSRTLVESPVSPRNRRAPLEGPVALGKYSVPCCTRLLNVAIAGSRPHRRSCRRTQRGTCLLMALRDGDVAKSVVEPLTQDCATRTWWLCRWLCRPQRVGPHKIPSRSRFPKPVDEGHGGAFAGRSPGSVGRPRRLPLAARCRRLGGTARLRSRQPAPNRAARPRRRSDGWGGVVVTAPGGPLPLDRPALPPTPPIAESSAPRRPASPCR